MDRPWEQQEVGAQRLSGFVLLFLPLNSFCWLAFSIPQSTWWDKTANCFCIYMSSFSDTQGKADFFCQLQFPDPGGEFWLAYLDWAPTAGPMGCAKATLFNQHTHSRNSFGDGLQRMPVGTIKTATLSLHALLIQNCAWFAAGVSL